MAAVESSLARKRCLVLDDEFLIALDIQQVLESAGAASVVAASTPGAALAAIDAGPRFDVAVLDVKLSGTATSLTVAAALAEQATPFVFLTGMLGEADHTRQFPNAPVVEKPYQASLLLAALAKALAGR